MAKKDISDFAEPRVKPVLRATKEPWAQLVAMETRGQQALKETPAQLAQLAKRVRKVLQVLVETRAPKVPKVQPAKLAPLVAKAT
jgi:hypothetical protein